jgi:hypothetical protein
VTHVRPLFLLALIGAWAASARADVVLIGVGTTPGDATDLSGLTGKGPDGTPHNRLGGHGSAVAYTGTGTEYVFAADRGPKGTNNDFVCRFHRIDVRVSPGAKEPVTLKLLATTLLTDENGKPFVGNYDAFAHAKPEKNLRLDPEGVRVGRDGAIYVSDEFGPVIYEFDARGKRRRSLPVPAHFQIAKPGKTPADELPPKNTSGRLPNRGMEGLAIAPDGGKLYGIMQNPLIQDGALNTENKRGGVNNRILEIELATGKTREFVYRLDDPAHMVCEILAVNDHAFLVLERDAKGGTDASCKKLFLTDLTDTTDVSGVAALPAGALPPTVTPAKKKLFLDLLNPKFKIAGADCPDKFEGIAFGPDLPDGRHLLLVTADNDFLADKPFRLYAFAIDKADLPAFQPQQFGSKK